MAKLTKYITIDALVKMKRFRILAVICFSLVLVAMLVGCAGKVLTEERFKTLLTVEDIENVLTSMVVLETEFLEETRFCLERELTFHNHLH